MLVQIFPFVASAMVVSLAFCLFPRVSCSRHPDNGRVCCKQLAQTYPNPSYQDHRLRNRSAFECHAEKVAVAPD
jgi:hypothetical protein